ncbi:hypothetical protein NP493_905g00056 [Ridgeia piscesae]|uniref:Glycerophosphocholine acyltransferase 1 n=1 Tax=Ridgeia piscesae TaxID=27915 RepID=A0AAD9KMB9_RIDPI|nr:hypothetical protein NP493_905g00056 [Ridgeia piscesae]
MCVIQLHWLLPYHYSIAMPILITVRVVMYWKSKQQYFMLDFCYFGNALCFFYIWAFPMNTIMSCIIFAVSTGPMAWATCLFRNSLVFHSVDKMTSIYIHVLPAYLMYSIRWYPESTSLHWYTSFVSDFDLSLWEMFVWLFGLGFLCFVLHSVIYTVVVYVLLRPSPDYLNSYRYLSAREDSCVGKLINIFGPKLRFAMYIGWNWIYCLLSLLVVLGCYQFFIFHTVLIAVVTFVITWNGAGYYMDVFSIKGFGFDD